MLVVADAREESPDSVARAIGLRRFPVRQLRAAAPGASAARNRGWLAASSPVILFLGDDILASPRLIREHLDWHGRYPEPAVGVLGRVRWAKDLPWTPFMRWLEDGFQFDYRSIRGTEAGWGRFYTANVSVKQDLLERAGGFDESFPFLYEDTELAYRLSSLGFRLLYNRDADAEHLHPTTLDDWRVRVASIAVAERRFVDKHPEVDPFFFQRLSDAYKLPRVRGRGARLVGIVPRRFPWLGRRVWESTDLHFRQELAEPFLAAWRSAKVDRPATQAYPAE